MTADDMPQEPLTIAAQGSLALGRTVMTNDGAFCELNQHEIADQISAFLAEKNRR
jgi:hypothetical protein